jgi:hypothetical protein
MITRAQMPRQLRDKGGIASVTPRENYGLGSKIKERFRKLIPNELADVAVKAAPFVAPFNPGVAGLMRGIGRFDQRGSISDAVKQGAATFGFGAGARALGGADPFGGGLKGGFTSPLDAEKTTKFKTLFEGGKDIPEVPGKERDGSKLIQKGVDTLKEKIPLLENVKDDVAQKLLVGGLTAGASALYSFFTGEFEPQEPGESLEEYMARRRESVKSQMRQVMDSYYTPLRNPQYAALSSEEKDKFIDGIVGQGMAIGGRVGFEEGGTGFTKWLKANYGLEVKDLDLDQYVKFSREFNNENPDPYETGREKNAKGGKGGMPTGIMRTNKAGVMERDYRDKGGFVPVGIKEKADDVPAMLSKNEFVFTADAVRGAGNGSIEKGAQRMYDTMKNLEKRVT